MPAQGGRGGSGPGAQPLGLPGAQPVDMGGKRAHRLEQLRRHVLVVDKDAEPVLDGGQHQCNRHGIEFGQMAEQPRPGGQSRCNLGREGEAFGKHLHKLLDGVVRHRVAASGLGVEAAAVTLRVPGVQSGRGGQPRPCPLCPPAMVPFVKMHGAGNDFVIFDARERPVALDPARVRLLADRHRGIGCDQLFRLEPSSRADLFLRIWNPDGSEAAACGNGTRCVAALTGARRIETAAGVCEVEGGQGHAVAMGVPRFEWEAIPLAMPMDTLHMPVAWEGLADPGAVSMGNPHLVFLVADPDAVPLERLGPLIERDPLFPERVNVGVAAVETPASIRLRVWERGAGLTLACGSGACAAFAVARRRRLVEPRATVQLPGGALEIRERADGQLLMAGPVAEVFRGEIAL